MKTTLIALLAVIGLSACTVVEKSYVCNELGETDAKHTLVIVGSQFIYDGIAYQIEEYQPKKDYWIFKKDDWATSNTFTSIYFNKKAVVVDIEVRTRRDGSRPFDMSVTKSHHISFCR